MFQRWPGLTNAACTDATSCPNPEPAKAQHNWPKTPQVLQEGAATAADSTLPYRRLPCVLRTAATTYSPLCTSCRRQIMAQFSFLPKTTILNCSILLNPASISKPFPFKNERLFDIDLRIGRCNFGLI